MPLSRNWLFTLNNPTNLDDPNRWLDRVVYCTWQLEQVETMHYQGYLQIGQPKSLDWVRTYINPRAHWAMRRGSHQQAKDYCRKEDSRLDGPWEFGQEVGSQGSRSDLSELKTVLDNGGTLLDCFDAQYNSTVRYHRGLELYRRLKSKHRSVPPEVIVLQGDLGSGKTRFIFDNFPSEQIYQPMNDGWWEEYNSQRVCLLDDYPWPAHNLAFVLRLLDRYPITVNVKGSSARFNSPIIAITTNVGWDYWYIHGEALERRITTHWVFQTGEIIVKKGLSPELWKLEHLLL